VQRGTKILVTETLKWTADGYELTGKVEDVEKNNSLIELKLEVPRDVSESSDDPVVLKDPDTGISLVVMKGKQSGFPVFRQVKCEECRPPPYPEEAWSKGISGNIVLLITVTVKGVAQDVCVAKSLEPGLDAATVNTVRSWHFKPAIGFDGKPFAVRTPVGTTFNALPNRQLIH